MFLIFDFPPNALMMCVLSVGGCKALRLPARSAYIFIAMEQLQGISGGGGTCSDCGNALDAIIVVTSLLHRERRAPHPTRG